MQPVKETNFDEHLLNLAETIDEFEGYLRPHAVRVAVLADEVAKRFNLAPHDRHSLRQAALVHDVGEVVMNRDYIKADRLLREDERIDMQRHTVIGEQEAAKRGLSRAVQLLVRWHHEWWNGAGYPDALERDLIPLAARILRVCDTYAALTDQRPYRGAMSKADARKYLVEWAGIEFDPFVVKAFLNLEDLKELKSFDAVLAAHAATETNRTSEREDVDEPEIREEEAETAGDGFPVAVHSEHQEQNPSTTTYSSTWNEENNQSS